RAPAVQVVAGAGLVLTHPVDWNHAPLPFLLGSEAPFRLVEAVLMLAGWSLTHRLKGRSSNSFVICHIAATTGEEFPEGPERQPDRDIGFKMVVMLRQSVLRAGCSSRR
ncbi:MAG TPA: hypothetical protein VHK65_18895, partial [Candidatus Dormibacteraeota bacterium]|nr:hypothetical protein [Candidatus Dormibacteraeota bacterium]